MQFGSCLIYKSMRAWNRAKKYWLFPVFFYLAQNTIIPFAFYFGLDLLWLVQRIVISLLLFTNQANSNHIIQRIPIFYLPLKINSLISTTVVASAIILPLTLFVILMLLTHNTEKTRSIKKIIAAIISYSYLFITTVGATIIDKILIDNCNQPTSYKIGSILVMAIYAFLVLLFNFFLTDHTIDSKLPWCGNSVMQMLLQFVTTFYSVFIAYHTTERRAHLSVLSLLTIASSAHISYFNTFHKKPVIYLHCFLNFGVCWMSICSCCNSLSKQMLIGGILSVILTPFAGILGIIIFLDYTHQLCKSLFCNNNLNKRKFQLALSNVFYHILAIMNNDKHNKIELNQNILYHAIQCNNANCYCIPIMNCFKEKEDISYILYSRFIIRHILSYKTNFKRGVAQLWVSEAIFTFMHFKLSSLANLMISSHYLKGSLNEYQIYTIRWKIMKALKDESVASMDSSVKIDNLLQYHNKYQEFQSTLYHSAKETHEFWKNIDTKRCSYEDLFNISEKISSLNKHSQRIFEDLKIAHPNFVKPLVLNALFYLYVWQDKESSKFLKKIVKSIKRSFNNRE